MHKSGIFNVTNTPNSGVRVMLVSLGCVLAFAPQNAMAVVNVSSPNCTQVAAANCSTLTAITPPGTIVCNAYDIEDICLQSSMNSTQKVRIRACSCGNSATDQEIKNNFICGTITLHIPKCTTDRCTNVVCTNKTNTTQPGYEITEKQKCDSNTGLCVYNSHSATCASGYDGTAECTRKKFGTVAYFYSCTGCEQTCSSNADCDTTEQSTTSGNYYITTGYECRDKSGKTYKICQKVTKNCECIQGTYGTLTPSDDTTIQCNGTCTACPIDPITGIAGTTKAKGTTSIKDCYLPKTDGNVTYTNAKGTFKYTGDCHHPGPNNNQ